MGDWHVQEEDCDGLCWQYIQGKVLNPEMVIITEPTNLGIYRGHRAYGDRSHPKVFPAMVRRRGGINAVYMMAKVVNEIEKLNTRLAMILFGQRHCAVSYIDCKTPSMCAVPDRAFIHLDRRLTRGETKDIAVAEVKDAIKRAGVEAEVEVLKYAVPSYTNFTYETEKYFPTWVLEEEHVVCKSSVETFEKLFGQKARVDKWTFSTNGIATMGMMGIPTIGFGPANEIHAHSVDDQCPVEHLVKARLHAAFPIIYCQRA